MNAVLNPPGPSAENASDALGAVTASNAANHTLARNRGAMEAVVVAKCVSMVPPI